MKLGSFVFITMKPLKRPMQAAKANVIDDRRPHAEAPLGGQQAEQQAGRAGHHARREVELAADHQQRDDDGHDARASRRRRSSWRRRRACGSCPRWRRRRAPTASAPISAPSSGLRSSFVREADLGQPVVDDADRRRRGRRRGDVGLGHQRSPASANFWTWRGVVLGRRSRAGEDRLAAADGAQVALVEHQHLHRQVALQVLLLVDREQDVAGRDALDDVAGLRSNVASLAFEFAPLIASRAAIAMSGLSASTASIGLVGLQLGLDLGQAGLRCRSVPLTCMFSTSPPKPFLAPSQRSLRPMLPCSWMTHSSFLAPFSLSALPAASPARALGLADVRERAELLVGVQAGVERDHRDAGVDGLGAPRSRSRPGRERRPRARRPCR